MSQQQASTRSSSRLESQTDTALNPDDFVGALSDADEDAAAPAAAVAEKRQRSRDEVCFIYSSSFFVMHHEKT
jgi:hypothetical protein